MSGFAGFFLSRKPPPPINGAPATLEGAPFPGWGVHHYLDVCILPILWLFCVCILGGAPLFGRLLPRPGGCTIIRARTVGQPAPLIGGGYQDQEWEKAAVAVAA